MSDDPELIFCAVEDPPQGPIGPLAFGMPTGRWQKGVLMVDIAITDCNFASTDPTSHPFKAIMTAFRKWEKVAPYFSFHWVPAGTPADITVRFGGTDLHARFTGQSGVLGVAYRPELGIIQFDVHEEWSDGSDPRRQDLIAVAVHEIGHVLGLSHSSIAGGTMYPRQAPTADIDPDCRAAMALLYGWAPQARLGDRGTSDRAVLTRTRYFDFTSSLDVPQMFWKGAGADSRLYQSVMQDGDWAGQEFVENFSSSHSPAALQIDAADGFSNTGTLLAFKGARDESIAWTLNWGDGWFPARVISGAQSSMAPALGAAAGKTFLAWKGGRNDRQIHWAVRDGNDWEHLGVRRGIGTSHSPALAGIGSRLFMFWKGVDGDQGAYWSMIDYAGEGIWTPQERISYVSYEIEGAVPYAIGTSSGLSAVTRGDSILLAWKGIEGDSGIYTTVFDGSDFGGQIRLAQAGTSVGPTVTIANGNTLLAWQGAPGDRTIYWSQMAIIDP